MASLKWRSTWDASPNRVFKGVEGLAQGNLAKQKDLAMELSQLQALEHFI